MPSTWRTVYRMQQLEIFNARVQKDILDNFVKSLHLHFHIFLLILLALLFFTFDFMVRLQTLHLKKSHNFSCLLYFCFQMSMFFNELHPWSSLNQNAYKWIFLQNNSDLYALAIPRPKNHNDEWCVGYNVDGNRVSSDFYNKRGCGETGNFLKNNMKSRWDTW